MMTHQHTTRHRYSVFVNDCEINNHFLTYDQACKLADDWQANGYEDVHVEEMVSDPGTELGR
jgi:hypothetical protein